MTSRLALAVVLAGVASIARADVVIQTPSGGDAGEPVAVLVRGEEQAVLTVAREIPPGTTEVVWVLPVPRDARDAAHGSAGAARDLERASAPRARQLWERDPCRIVTPADVERDPRHASERRAAVFASRSVQGPSELELSLHESAASALRAMARRGIDADDESRSELRAMERSDRRLLVAHARFEPEPGRTLVLAVKLRLEASDAHIPAPSPRATVLVLDTQRVRAAGRETVPVPADLRLRAAAFPRFDAVYEALLEQSLAVHAGAVITEHVESGAPLSASQLRELGADEAFDVEAGPFDARLVALAERLVLTRLRTTTGPLQLEADRSPPARGQLGGFRAEYEVRHPWRGPMPCNEPTRGRWTGRPPADWRPEPASDGAVDLSVDVLGGVPGLGVEPGAPGRASPPEPTEPSREVTDPGQAPATCHCRVTTVAGRHTGAVPAIVALLWTLRRRRSWRS